MTMLIAWFEFENDYGRDFVRDEQLEQMLNLCQRGTDPPQAVNQHKLLLQGSRQLQDAWLDTLPAVMVIGLYTSAKHESRYLAAPKPKS